MDSLRAITSALTDGRSEVREAALQALESLYVRCENGSCTTAPDVAQVALPLALRALSDPDAGVRVTGVRAIRLMAADAAALVPSLAAARADPAALVRREALGALGELGVSGSAAERKANRRSASL